MGAQSSACHLTHSDCAGRGKLYRVLCAVQRVALHRKQQAGALNRFFGPSDQQIYVEVSVADDSSNSSSSSSRSNKKTLGSTQTYRTEAGQRQEATWDLWTWSDIGEEKSRLDDKEPGQDGVITLQALASSSLSLRVVAVEASTSWLSGAKDTHPRVLGEAQLSIQEDIIASVGTSGEFTWPLVLDNLVCGSIGLFMSFKSEDVFRLDCGRIDDQVFEQDSLEVMPDAMYGKTQHPELKAPAVEVEKRDRVGVSMQFLGKEMIVSHVCVQKGSLGVKVGPVRISPAMVCLKVLHVNDEARADGLGIGKGDLLYGIDGGTFSGAEEFMMRLKLPPYLLTVLRA